jgi:UDPglucose 6-dehydrogenase
LNITVIGAGYVGLTSAVCLAEIGHMVTCLDVDEERIQHLNKGHSPLFEPGIEQSLQKNLKNQKLTFTTEYSVACQSAEVIIITVGTPSNPNGSANLSAIRHAAFEIGAHLCQSGVVIVTKSTVPVGTNRKIEHWLKHSLTLPVSFSIASNPEFLREGSAIHDTFNGDRIVIGVKEKRASEILKRMYDSFNIPILETTIESAEMIKYASNAFLATKISFINEIANLCEKVNANIDDVAKGMAMDQRIGNKFLQAGIGYGGSCFPKDTHALVQLAGDIKYSLDLLESVIKVNAKQQIKLVSKAKKHFSSLKGKKAGMLGLSFKPNTDDVREAASIEMIKHLLTLGVHVTVYDPAAIPNAKKILGQSVSYADDTFEAIEDQDMLFIATEWEEFKGLRLKTIVKLMNEPVIFDGRNCYSLEEANCVNVDYYSIGRAAVLNSTSMRERTMQ